MSSLTQIVTTILSLLSIVAQVASVAIIIALITKHPLRGKISQHALLVSFLVALIATSGSLFYSDVAGFEPCKFCWFQRIFMYPQVILLGYALRTRMTSLLKPCGILSGIGALIAGYHYLLQLGVVTSAPCSAIGYSASCSQRFFMTFGYITIPMMAFSAFLLMTVLCIANIMASKQQAHGESIS